jgi:hypothetical protein
MNFKAVLSTALFATAGAAFAQSSPQINPQSIIVNPVTPDLQVRVSVDRPGLNPIYNIGDRIRITVSVNQDAYVYLFSVHADGAIDLVLPNRLSGGNEFLRAGETRSFPPAQGAAYALTVGGPQGQDKVLAVASKRPLNINEIAGFQGNNQFADVGVQGQDNLARALSIIVTPVPPSDWVTAVAFYQVGNQTVTPPPPPAPTTGVVQVISTQGANVYIDGQLVGQAPLNFSANTGQRQIRIQLDGYRDYTATINVVGGRTTVVNAPLQAIPREGVLSLRSNVAGALVFINGNQIGRIGSSGVLNITRLPVGTHEVVVIAPGYRAFVQTFTIQPGQTTSLFANLFRI